MMGYVLENLLTSLGGGGWGSESDLLSMISEGKKEQNLISYFLPATQQVTD
jgi:hypothetical protein